MIINGYIDWAVKHLGPSQKVYAKQNEGLGIVWHSMEGWLAGSFAELAKTDRSASWKFSISLDGTLYQHYPVTASEWASGNEWANTKFWSCELEGIYSMPINEAQIQTALKLIKEWEIYSGFKGIRTGDINSQSMHLHREVGTIVTPNAGPTACPSQRYDNLWLRLDKENTPMTNEELNQIVQDLNSAMVKRMALFNIGSGDYDLMLKAYDTLKLAGIIK